jgi:ergothioneine biosynthesis protein EgtB
MKAANESMTQQFLRIRSQTQTLVEPLEPEDFLLQESVHTSPVKWHLAHTSWFFETFVLKAAIANYEPVREDSDYLFNSYYNAVGDRIARDRRGLLSRPTIGDIFRYRAEIDFRIVALLESLNVDELEKIRPIVILGLNHEQQHQELILTDLKAAFGWNPTRPVYGGCEESSIRQAPPLPWLSAGGEIRSIGFAGNGFSFDNETPRHRVFLEPFAIASRPSTNAEYLAFMADGGYDRPELWLSDGWAVKNLERWSCPKYWEKVDPSWTVYTLAGMRPLVESQPVVHLSYYEADAFARWSNARLPTEAEWEIVASELEIDGNFLDSKKFHPETGRETAERPCQMFGDVWEWTGSPYIAFPGFQPATGALGEYNGKFMCNQMVLRGGSCATPTDHIRPSYRNFFPPEARWQFSGVRLARDER